MTWNVKYATFGQTTGNNDGTSLADAWRTPTNMMNGVVAGDRVEMRQDPSTPYTHTVNMSIRRDGTPTTPIWFRGYSSTPGDGGICSVQWQGGGIHQFVANGNYHIWENFSIQPASTGENLGGITLGSSYSSHRNVHAAGSGTLTIPASAFRSVYRAAQLSNAGATLSNSGTNTHSMSAHECVFINDESSSNRTALMTNDAFGRHSSYTNCIFINRTAVTMDAIRVERYHSSRGLTFVGNIFYNFNSAISLDNLGFGQASFSRVSDNVFVDMARYAVEQDGTPIGSMTANDNWFHNCTIGFSNLDNTADRNVALSANPLVDPANGDFRINNLANGGAVIRARNGSVIDPLGVEPMEAYTLAALLEPTGGGGGGSPVTRSWWG